MSGLKFNWIVSKKSAPKYKGKTVRILAGTFLAKRSRLTSPVIHTDM